MILTRGIIARLAVLGILVAVAQVVCFSKMDVFGASPDVALLVVISVGTAGGEPERCGYRLFDRPPDRLPAARDRWAPSR